MASRVINGGSLVKRCGVEAEETLSVRLYLFCDAQQVHVTERWRRSLVWDPCSLSALVNEAEGFEAEILSADLESGESMKSFAVDAQEDCEEYLEDDIRLWAANSGR